MAGVDIIMCPKTSVQEDKILTDIETNAMFFLSWLLKLSRANPNYVELESNIIESELYVKFFWPRSCESKTSRFERVLPKYRLNSLLFNKYVVDKHKLNLCVGGIADVFLQKAFDKFVIDSGLVQDTSINISKEFEKLGVAKPLTYHPKIWAHFYIFDYADNVFERMRNVIPITDSRPNPDIGRKIETNCFGGLVYV